MSEQQKQLLRNPQDLISLSLAAEATPYSAEYLSLLSRKGRIPAIKISRDWLTTRQAVLSYVKEQKRKHEKLMDRFDELDSHSHSTGRIK